jgi:hypothetical protein
MQFTHCVKDIPLTCVSAEVCAVKAASAVEAQLRAFLNTSGQRDAQAALSTGK